MFIMDTKAVGGFGGQQLCNAVQKTRVGVMKQSPLSALSQRGVEFEERSAAGPIGDHDVTVVLEHRDQGADPREVVVATIIENVPL